MVGKSAVRLAYCDWDVNGSVSHFLFWRLFNFKLLLSREYFGFELDAGEAFYCCY